MIFTFTFREFRGNYSRSQIRQREREREGEIDVKSRRNEYVQNIHG